MRVQDVVLDGAHLPVEENGSAIQVDGGPSPNLPRPDELRRILGQGGAPHVAESEWSPPLRTRSGRLKPRSDGRKVISNCRRDLGGTLRVVTTGHLDGIG